MTVRESKETVRAMRKETIIAMRLNDNPGPRYEMIQKIKDDDWQLVLKAFRAKYYPTIEGSGASVPTK